jgi:hypothetical protein
MAVKPKGKVTVTPETVKAAKAANAAKSSSTSLARANAQLPTNYQEQMAAEVAALGTRLAAPTGKAIQVTQSKQFRFPDETKVDSFKGVIVGFVSTNAYYEGDFDKDNIVPPNCFAIGVVKNDELMRSENSPDPQPEDGGMACANCWANQWKSAAKGNGKACKNGIKLAILCADGEVRPMSLSSTALKPFGEYVRDVAMAFNKPPFGVMTEFTFAESDYSSVRCGDAIELNDKQLAEVMMLRDDAMAMLQTEPDVSEFEEKVVAKRAKPQGKAAAKSVGKRA